MDVRSNEPATSISILLFISKVINEAYQVNIFNRTAQFKKFLSARSERASLLRNNINNQFKELIALTSESAPRIIKIIMSYP